MSNDKIVVEIDLGLIATEEDTVASIIVDRAARSLLNHNKEAVGAFLQRLSKITDEEIRTAIQPLVAAALLQPIQKTTGYGRPTGDPLPLTELIIETAREALKEPVNRRDSHQQKSLLQTLVHEEVERALRAELQDEIKKARGEVLAAVRDQGAQVITETITRMARA